jgi:hypothetical protein
MDSSLQSSEGVYTPHTSRESLDAEGFDYV